MTGEEVRHVRLALGLTQQELADELGIRQPTVSQMEAGSRRVSRRTEVQIRQLVERRGAQSPEYQPKEM